jgi:hypothetical protein
MFRAIFCPSSGVLDLVLQLWFSAPSFGAGRRSAEPRRRLYVWCGGCCSIVASSWSHTLYHIKDARSNEPQITVIKLKEQTTLILKLIVIPKLFSQHTCHTRVHSTLTCSPHITSLISTLATTYSKNFYARTLQ